MTNITYTFKLTGDYNAKLAELADADNVISLNPLSASKAEFACYQMYHMMETSSQLSKLGNSVNTLQESVTTLSGTVVNLNTKVSDLETAANNKDLEIQELKDGLLEANRKMDAQQRDLTHLMKRADKCDQANLELERHSRSSNLRVGNIEETTNEDCKAKVLAAFSQMDVGAIDIENCHRVGEKKDQKTRFIIVRFVRRIERREVLSKRKNFFEKGFPLYEDLPKQDLDLKKKFSKEIEEHHRKKDRCYFSGYLYN